MSNTRTHRGSVLPIHCVVVLVAIATPVPTLRASAAGPETVSVRDFGAKGDGRTDDTAAFQKALDAVAKGGGTVQAGRGSFYFAGHLNVPRGVTLEGIWKSVPSHTGIRDRGGVKPTDDGTTFLVTENRGSEDGPAFITLNENSTLKGVVIYYPDQKTDEASGCLSLRRSPCAATTRPFSRSSS